MFCDRGLLSFIMCPYVMFFYLLDLFSYQVSLVVTACSDSLVRVFNTLTQSLVRALNRSTTSHNSPKCSYTQGYGLGSLGLELRFIRVRGIYAAICSENSYILASNK